MKGAGLSFNMMTLGGLAAGIGLFIDDAIVMIEAIHRARSGGAPTEEAIIAALTELSRALVASTLTVIVVFVPLMFMRGVTGVFFRALALTLGAGLAISLALALYFTPALEMTFERVRSEPPPGRIFDLLNRACVMVLAPIIRFPALAIAGAVIASAAAVFFYQSIGTDYLPELDEGEFILDYLTPPQGTLTDTDALVGQIQQVLQSTPEVEAFSRRTGTQLGFFLTESNRGDISVRLKPNRSRSIDEDYRFGARTNPRPGARREYRIFADAAGSDWRSLRGA